MSEENAPLGAGEQSLSLYKARVSELERDLEEEEMICPSCNKDFKPHNRLQKYCDSSCRNKANYKKHKRINRAELIAWIENNRHEAIYGALRENVVNMEKLLEFINKGEKQNE